MDQVINTMLDNVTKLHEILPEHEKHQNTLIGEAVSCGLVFETDSILYIKLTKVVRDIEVIRQIIVDNLHKYQYKFTQLNINNAAVKPNIESEPVPETKPVQDTIVKPKAKKTVKKNIVVPAEPSPVQATAPVSVSVPVPVSVSASSLEPTVSEPEVKPKKTVKGKKKLVSDTANVVPAEPMPVPVPVSVAASVPELEPQTIVPEPASKSKPRKKKTE
jgi:hypothetical protein